jgi:uncharacterized RDD family membrane protein YckC
MKTQEYRSALFNIGDYSFEIYKMLFFRLTALSILVHIPIFLLEHYGNSMVAMLNQREDSVSNIVLTMVFFLGIFNILMILLFTGYIIMKSFVTYTELIGKGMYKLNITFSSLLSKFQGLVFYGLFLVFLLFLVRQFGFTVLLMLGYFVFGRSRLLSVFPWVDIPIGFGFWDGILALFITLGLFAWVAYLFVRWMFGYQGMFIDDQKTVRDAIRRSFYVTKGYVGFIVLYFGIVFLFQAWLLGSVTGLFIGIPSLINIVVYPINFSLNDILVLVSAIFYPIQVIFITMVYIFLKFKKDALSLEFKMLKMMGKEELKDSVEYDLFEPRKVEGKNQTAGLLGRFTANFIDFLISVTVVVVINVVLFFLRGKKIIGDLEWFSGLPDPYDQFFPYVYIGILVMIANFILVMIWELILKGNTPGKMMIGLRVLSNNGEEPKALQILLRNLMRGIDFLPFFYLGGVFIMATKGKQRRLGDIFSGTKVVKNFGEGAFQEVSQKKLGSNLPPRLNLYPITPLEFEVLTEFLDQSKLSPKRRAFFSHHLNIYFHLKFNPGEKYKDPYEFFKDIVSMNMHLEGDSF